MIQRGSISRGVLGLVAALVMVVVGSGCSMFGPLMQLAVPAASAKLMFACIPSGSRIDTPSEPKSIESLEPGDVVMGFDGKPVRVLQKHSYLEDPGTTFLRVTFSDGAVVDLCGMHRIAGVRARGIKIGQTLDGREVTSIESRKGEKLSYDLLTEDAGYRIGGVRINSMIQEMQEAGAGGLREIRK